MPNHWSDDDLVIEERTLFRQVGWQGANNHAFYAMGGEAICKRDNLGGYAPVYVQIATDHGDGWED